MIKSHIIHHATNIFQWVAQVIHICIKRLQTRRLMQDSGNLDFFKLKYKDRKNEMCDN